MSSPILQSRPRREIPGTGPSLLGCRQPLGSEEEALGQHVGCGVQTGSAD